MSVFKHVYRADTLCMASIRTLAYRMMVAAPVALIGGIGFEARTEKSDWQFVQSTPELDQRILAYRDVLDDPAKSPSNEPGAMSIEEARQRAHRWIDGSRRGILKPLPAAAYEDTMRDGVKGEILQTNGKVADRLNFGAFRLLHSNPKQAAEDALLAMECVGVLRMSDFVSLSTTTMLQRRSMAIVRTAMPSVSESLRKAWAERIEKTRIREADLTRLAAGMRRLYFEYQIRRGEEPVSISETTHMIDPFRLTLASTELDHRRTPYGAGLMASRVGSPVVYSEVRVGFVAARDTNRRIDEVWALVRHCPPQSLVPNL